MPDRADQIHVTADRHFTELSAQALDHGGVHDPAIKAKRGMSGQDIAQIGFDRWDALVAHTHQLDAAAFQLLRGLDEITAVGPQLRLIGREYTSAGRTGKAAHVLSCLEMITYIFGFVEIGCRNDIGIHAMRLHLGAQLFHSRFDFIHRIHSAFSHISYLPVQMSS